MKDFEPFTGKAEEMMAAAREAVGGLDDFGDPETFVAGLYELLAALDNDRPNFTADGYEFTYNTIVGVLISRLLTEQGWKDRPDCLEHMIKKPLIVTGIPRTGTTALHKLLSVDPQFQGMECWLTIFPMPRPPRDQWESNPWYQACEDGFDAFFAAVPELRAIHNVRAEDVDECLNVLRQDFCSNFFGSSLPVPSYDRWWLQQSEAPCYQRFYKVMQLIGANSPTVPWLLKNPGHVANIDLLLDTFPDARVIQTHRDPVKAIPSLFSTLKFVRKAVEGDNVQLELLGQREMNYWGRAVEGADKARERAPKQFFDVIQDDFHRDPMATVRSIYDFYDLELSSAVIAAMRKRIELNPESSHGKHHYSVEQFGITEAAIKERFAGYCQRHLA